MIFRRGVCAVAVGLAATALLVPGCKRSKSGEVTPIVPKVEFNRTKIPAGSAIEITYTWTVEPGAKRLGQEYRALVHFLDEKRVKLFDDDHIPVPPPSEWEPGKTYTYKRTRFVPVLPYAGPVEVRMGLYPFPGRGDRLALKGEDVGLREYKVASVELQPHTENIYVAWKEGFHAPEAHAENPMIEQTWTKQNAVISFKNPKRDVIVYLEADTCVKCFGDTRPELTLAIGPSVGLKVPIQDPDLFLRKIRVKAADLGTEEYVDIKLSMNASFVPKLMSPPQSNDDRVLGLRISNVSVVEAEKVGSVDGVVDAQPLAPPPAPAKTAKPAKTK